MRVTDEVGNRRESAERPVVIGEVQRRPLINAGSGWPTSPGIGWVLIGSEDGAPWSLAHTILDRLAMG